MGQNGKSPTPKGEGQKVLPNRRSRLTASDPEPPFTKGRNRPEADVRLGPLSPPKGDPERHDAPENGSSIPGKTTFHASESF